MPDSKLTAPDHNTVESSEGWRCHFAGNSPLTWRIVYEEGLDQVEIGVEGGVETQVFFFVYLSAVEAWSAGSASRRLTEDDRKRISQNVVDALEKLKIPCRVT